MNSVYSPLLALVCSAALQNAVSAESFFKAGDSVAIVGGEEMAVAAENGALEALVLRALPDSNIRFRSLAWEGDTVFEQPRDLNYPSLEQQLDEINATVVLVQFGLMESLGGEPKIGEFIAAYEKLIERLSAGGKRRVVIISPASIASGATVSERFRALPLYSAAIARMAQERGLTFVTPEAKLSAATYRDGIHLNAAGHAMVAIGIARALGAAPPGVESVSTDAFRFADSIRLKNQYWYHYARPQNWAFLNGDRTTQPSSRDHKDPSKRWFPEEMKEWLPLISAKEQEIWAMARQLQAK